MRPYLGLLTIASHRKAISAYIIKTPKRDKPNGVAASTASSTNRMHHLPSKRHGTILA